MLPSEEPHSLTGVFWVRLVGRKNVLWAHAAEVAIWLLMRHAALADARRMVGTVDFSSSGLLERRPSHPSPLMTLLSAQLGGVPASRRRTSTNKCSVRSPGRGYEHAVGQADRQSPQEPKPPAPAQGNGWPSVSRQNAAMWSAMSATLHRWYHAAAEHSADALSSGHRERGRRARR
jgi:hypothetical protein